MFDVKKKFKELRIKNILRELKSANEKYIRATLNNSLQMDKLAKAYVRIQMQAESILEKYKDIQNKDVENIKKIIENKAEPWAKTLEKAKYQGVPLRL